MYVKEYLEKLNNEKVTFVIVEAVKDEAAPIYNEIFRQTPIREAYEWKEGNLLDYIVVKLDNAPLDMSGIWTNWYKQGHLKCCMIISEETLRMQYSPKQAEDMIEMYKNRL